MKRLQSKKPVKVQDTIIGGEFPLICLPIVAVNRDDLLRQAEELVDLSPDMIEWRVDGFSLEKNIQYCVHALERLRGIVDRIPLIFTCRIESEGGLQSMSDEIRMQIINKCIQTGLVDIVDIEISNEKAFIASIRKTAAAKNTKMLLSYHDFNGTPKTDFIINTLVHAQGLGADIAKFACMPKDYKNVQTLLQATLTARKSFIDIPLITVSMEKKGAVSRILGGLFGSDITYAIGKKASAPGQIYIKELRRAMSLLYHQ